MQKPAIGIDLGTTYSLIAHINAAGRPEVLRDGEGNASVPSVVYCACAPPLVGKSAKEQQASGETDVAAFFKRSMGDPQFLLHLGGRDWSPVDLSALVLRELKSNAEAALGCALDTAVITVPAYFHNRQREATIEAGRQAGWEVRKIINEPTAAALAYGLQGASQTGRVVVYDLGGGTFDVSLVEIAPEEIRVLATAGDHNLGGKDWDDRIASYLAERFASLHGVNPLDDDLTFHELLTRAEAAKKSLSSREATTVPVAYQGRREMLELTRSTLEDLTRDLLERTQRLVEQVLEEAHLQWRDMTGVLLVGGSTRLRMVHEYVARMSGQPPMGGVNVDEAVALGAAVQAGIELKESLGQSAPNLGLVSSRRIRDVMSHSLGVVALSEDRQSYVNSIIIIKKNTAVPCQESKPYQLLTRSGQENELDVYMLQGESPDPLQCHVLGKYVFSGIAHVPSGPALVDLEYGYDRNGVVTVTARDRFTGRELPLCREHVPEDMGWLSQLRGISPYTVHAGLQRIPGAVTDRFGNAQGTQYDLAEDRAFDGYLIAVLDLCSIDFTRPSGALKEKGFKVHLWNSTPNHRDLAAVLQDACQVWVVSHLQKCLDAGHRDIICEFFESGKGLYIWGDNAPLFQDANFLASKLFGCQLWGDHPGDKVVCPQEAAGQPGFVSHLIMTGIENLYEGITVAAVEAGSHLQPLMYGSDRECVIAYYDHDGKRALLDGGFTRLFYRWDTAGTGRYVKNAASWLVNYERFGYTRGLGTGQRASSVQR